MPRRESSPITRAHVWLFVDDLNWLRETYGGTIGIARAVRTIVRAFRQKVEAKAQEVHDAPIHLEVNLEELSREHEQEHAR